MELKALEKLKSITLTVLPGQVGSVTVQHHLLMNSVILFDLDIFCYISSVLVLHNAHHKLSMHAYQCRYGSIFLVHKMPLMGTKLTSTKIRFYIL